jgi:hypothetical protein
MKIRRFWESTQSNDLLIIKDYFSSFSEDLDDICSTHFNKINDNLFEVIIRFTGDTTSQIKEETNLTKLDHWIDMNEVDNKILNELRSSMRALVDDDMLEEFILTKRVYGYSIEIHTKIKGDVSEWVYAEDYEIYYDKNRFKKIIKDTFGVDVESSYMQEEYDKNGDRYLEFGITFTEKISAEIAEKIKKFILDIQLDVDGDLEKAFKGSWSLYTNQKDTKTLYFEINSFFNDVR